MTTAHFYAYRAYGDRAGTAEMTMQPDPGTGDEPHIHPAGVVMSFESEEQRDAYIAQQVVATTLPDGRDRRWHWCQGRRQNIPLWRRESVPPG